MSTTPVLRLTPEGERAWLRCKTHLEWCDSFALIYLFSDQPGVVAIFRERLADIHRARVTRLRQFEPTCPEDLNPGLLLRLLEPPGEELRQEAPLWVELSLHGGAAWRQARLELLARLNEQRERLRTRQPRPVVLILPATERAAAVAIAPDLWSIRQFTLITGPWLSDTAEPAQHPLAASGLPQLFPLTPREEAAVAEWRRLHAKAAQDRGTLRAGWAAWQGLQEKERLAEAEIVANQTLALARTLAAEATPQALRDLSISLDNIGKTAQALGRWEEARVAFEESLGISERLAEALPELPEYTTLQGLFRARLEGLAVPKVKSCDQIE